MSCWKEAVREGTMWEILLHKWPAMREAVSERCRSPGPDNMQSIAHRDYTRKRELDQERTQDLIATHAVTPAIGVDATGE
jgi:hypothetical protein